MVRPTSASNRMRGRQQFAVLLHLLSTEQLGTKRCFSSVMLCIPKALAQACPNLKQISVSLPTIQRIISFLSFLKTAACACGPAVVFEKTTEIDELRLVRRHSLYCTLGRNERTRLSLCDAG